MNGDSHLKPLSGRCVSDIRQLNTRKKMLELVHGILEPYSNQVNMIA